MASDATFFEVLEADLRSLSSEARKTDSLATQITGWLQHTDFPLIKECAERALLRLRAISQEGKGIEAVRTKEILRPFLLVCESKNPKLIGAVLGSIQKLLAHNAVSDEGRQQVIQALNQVEKSSDDTVKLKILQTALTMLQNPSSSDNEEGAGQVLSLCIRIYCHSRSSPTVVSTAAATVRQAVALLFDHAVLESSGSSSGISGVATQKEVAAVLLLQDLMNMCAGHPPVWLKCPLVGRLFVLDLLEFVLLHRPTAFHQHSAFKALLQNKVGPCLADLSRTALDPEVDPASVGEAKLLLRCVGALLRKHVLLLPDLSVTLIETLLAGCNTNRMPWQRLLSLQVLRWLMSDPYLLYALFTSYDMSIHHDVNAVHDTLQIALEIVKAFIKVADASEEDLIGSLSAIYKSKLDGKDLQIDVDTMAPAHTAGQEVLLAVVSGVETLADAVNNATKPSFEQLQLAPLAVTATIDRCRSDSAGSLMALQRGNSAAQVTTAGAAGTGSTPRTPLSGSRNSAAAPSPAFKPLSRNTSANSSGNLSARTSNGPSVLASVSPRPSATYSVAALQQSAQPPLVPEKVSTLVDVLWRPLLAGLSGVLSRCTDNSRHEALMLQVLRAYQSYTYSAGGIMEVPARDAFLAALCEVAVTTEKHETPATHVHAAHAADGPQGIAGPRASGPAAAEDQQTTGTIVTASGPTIASTGPLGSAAAAALLGPNSICVADLKVKNIHALRILFNCAYRLADVLGSSWVLVVEVLCILDRAIPAGGQGSKLDDSAPGILSELLIILTIANQLFEQSSSMSPAAPSALMAALAETSRKILAAVQQQSFAVGAATGAGVTAPGGSLGGVGSPAGSAAGSTSTGTFRLTALSRMVEVLLVNLLRIQDLWPIFLTHILEVLHSGNPSIRAAAIDALDKSLTGAIAAPCLTSAQPLLSRVTSDSQPTSGAPPQLQTATFSASTVGDSNSSSAGAAGDVENMLLVALESMYKEEREPDVRLGLLRIALHVLQRHGESLSRGWVPLLRLLEVVPAWEDSSTISAAFVCVEAVSSDFLSTMPKQHLERALEVAHLFAAQKSAINISLSAIGLLWNATDLLGRSRAAAAAAAASTATNTPPMTPSGLQGALSTVFSMLTRKSSTLDEATSAVLASAVAASKPGSTSSSARATTVAGVPDVVRSVSRSAGGTSTDADGYQDPHLAGRSDLSEDECTELLLKLFKHLRKISMDLRPEVRNSGVRTLFLAVGGQAPRFKHSTWRYCMWEVLFPLVTYVYVTGDTSSSQEAAAVELGKEKGKSVMMLVHHSRNTEQKQWDETTVLALNGLGKVLKANMGTVVAMQGFDDKWDEMCSISAKMLSSGRKSVAIAAAQLLTGFLQSFKAPSSAPDAEYPWKRALQAIDEAVAVMAVPNTRVPMQARTELLSGLSGMLTAQQQSQEGGLDLVDTQQLLRWMDALARYPTGADDVTPVPGVLPPVQKLVLQVLGQFTGGVLPDAWPDLLRTFSGFLCPFKAMQQRQQREAATAVDSSGTTSTAAANGADSSGPRAAAAEAGSFLGRSLGRLTSSRPSSPAPPTNDALMLTNQWMGKILERLVVLYSHAPWQVRATLFGSVVGGLGECAALRYLCPDDSLWQQAAAGLVSVINAGLPAVNIMFVNHHQPPENAWQIVAKTFEMFLLGVNLPEGLMQQAAGRAQQQRLGSRELSHVSSSGSSSMSRRRSAEGTKKGSSSSSSQKVSDDPAEVESRLQAVVLDNLTDVVLASCSSAAHDLRAQLVRIVAAGAASTAGHQCGTAAAAAGHDTASNQHFSSTATAAVRGNRHVADAAMTETNGSIGHRTRQPERQRTPSPAAADTAAVAAAAVHCAPAARRFSQMCLRKLALLAGRGTEGSAGSMSAVMLEVAQIVLPLLLERCAEVLEAYAELEEAAAAGELATGFGSAVSQQQQQQLQVTAGVNAGDHQSVGAAVSSSRGASSSSSSTPAGHRDPVVPSSRGLGSSQPHATQNPADGNQQQQQDGNAQDRLQLQQSCLVEEVTCVLQVLVNLQLDASVVEDVFDQQPLVAACLHMAQHAQQQLYNQQQQQQHNTDLHSVKSLGRVASAAASPEGSPRHAARRQQGHLLLLYDLLARCVGCRDRSVGLLLRQALLSVGRQLFAY